MNIMKQIKKMIFLIALALTLIVLYTYLSYFLLLYEEGSVLGYWWNMGNKRDKLTGSICYVSSPNTENQQKLGCDSKDIELFQNVEFANVSFYLKYLGFEHYTECSFRQQPLSPEVPVIVSGTSSNHYEETVALCYNLNNTLRTKFRGIKLIIYDIGINNFDKSNILQRYCGCEIRKFPFSSFPHHVSNVHGYTWKPLIISLMLKEFPYVMWIDTSVRFDLNKPIQILFDKARICQIQQLMEPDWALAETCDIKTMEFLKQNAMDFMNSTNVEAGWAVYLRSEFLIQRILKPWVKCALTHGCMLTDAFSFAVPCIRPNPKLREPGLCHRFEQSVMGIILAKIYNKKSNNVLFGEKQYGEVRRGDAKFIPFDFLLAHKFQVTMPKM